MVASSVRIQCDRATSASPTQASALAAQLQQGEVVIRAESITEWGALVTAQLYVPRSPDRVWGCLSNCQRWSQLLPSLSESRQLDGSGHADGPLLYQAAGFKFLCFNPKVETYLKVREKAPYCLTFRQVRGTLSRFAAELQASPWTNGTLISYEVSARLPQPLPKLLLRQGIQGVLPYNLQSLRRSLLEALA